MIYSYYPGCTLKTKAKELDLYARAAAKALGVELREQAEWQCCGAVYPMAEDEIATRLSSVRALDAARREERDLLTLCSACHNVIKRVNHDMRTNDSIRTKVNAYLELDPPYEGETKVLHYLEMLRDQVGFDEIKKRVAAPFKGKKIGAYYGCLLLRPSDVMRFDNPENPTILEDFIAAIGGTSVYYPYRNECCGGYCALEDAKQPQRLVDQILASAQENGAEMIITACPLCLYNLQHNATAHKLPVYYFTQLLYEALGLAEKEG